MSDGFIDGKCTHYIGKSINFTSDEPVTGGNWTQFLTHNSGKVNRFVEGNQTESTMDRKQSILQGQRQARLVRNKQDRLQERSNNLAESV